MWFLSQILRYLLAILAGIVYAIVLGAILGAAGAVIFSPMIGMVGLGGGAVYGLGYGFQFVLEHFIPTEAENNNAPIPINIAIPQHLPEINETSEKIQRLQTIKKIKLLSQKEINRYQEMLTDDKSNASNVESQKELEHYQNYIEDYCGISQKPLNELDEPVTIEVLVNNKLQEKPWIHTYEKEELQKWVDTKGPHATEPFVGCDLSDAKYKVRIYAGFPEWVCNFITLVRSMLYLSTPASPKPTNSSSRVLTANHRNAFYAGYSSIFSTGPNNPTIVNERNQEPVRNIIPG